jgi:hypothetical protein
MQCPNHRGNSSSPELAVRLDPGDRPGIGVRKQGTTASVNHFVIVGPRPLPVTPAQTEACIAAQNSDGGGSLAINGDTFLSWPAFTGD